MLPARQAKQVLQPHQPQVQGDVSFASGEVLQQLLCRIQVRLVDVVTSNVMQRVPASILSLIDLCQGVTLST